MNQIEEIKNKLNNCVTVKIIDGEEYFNCKQVDMILDKYNNKPDLKEDLKVSLKETLTMQDLINQIKELQGFKSAFEQLEKEYSGNSDIDIEIRTYIQQELEQKYNLGGE